MTSSLSAVLQALLVLTHWRAVDNIRLGSILIVKVCLNTVLATTSYCAVCNNSWDEWYRRSTVADEVARRRLRVEVEASSWFLYFSRVKWLYYSMSVYRLASPIRRGEWVPLMGSPPPRHCSVRSSFAAGFAHWQGCIAPHHSPRILLSEAIMGMWRVDMNALRY